MDATITPEVEFQANLIWRNCVHFKVVTEVASFVIILYVYFKTFYTI